MVRLIPLQLDEHSLADVDRSYGDVAEELALIFQKAAHQDRSWRIGRIAIELKKGLNIVIRRSASTVEERSRQEGLPVSTGPGHGRAALRVRFLNDYLCGNVGNGGGRKEKSSCSELIAVWTASRT